MKVHLHPKQTQAFTSTCTELLYGGAAGGGKSHFMRVLAMVACMQISGVQVYLFRRKNPDLVKNHVYGPTGFLVMLHELIASGHCKYNAQENKFTFWNGSIIWLCHCQYEKDVYNYHGGEIHILLIDELTHFTEFMYRYLRGRMRVPDAIQVPEEWKSRLPLAVNGSNPGNVGHAWVKSTFIDPVPEGEIWETSPDEGGMLRQYIQARLTDNPSLDEETYRQSLQGLGSPALVEAMLNGNWDIVAGAMFADVWDPDKHVIAPFKVPGSWRVDRSFDWGSSKPWAVQWWAESDGTPATLVTGEELHVPRGTLFNIAELYGWNGKPNEGSRMLATEIAREVAEVEQNLGYYVNPGPADSAIYTNENGNCIADDMNLGGISWIPANKSPGSRVNGWQILRRRLKSTMESGEDPRMYFFNTCRHAIRTLPVLPVDNKKPDDIDTNAEDHIADATRYRVLDPEPGRIGVGPRI